MEAGVSQFAFDDFDAAVAEPIFYDEFSTFVFGPECVKFSGVSQDLEFEILVNLLRRLTLLIF